MGHIKIEIKPIEPCRDCIHYGTVFEEHTMPGQRPLLGYGCRRIANGEACKFEPYPKTDMQKEAEQLQEIKKEMAISLEKDMAKLTESLKRFNQAISKMLPSKKDFKGRIKEMDEISKVEIELKPQLHELKILPKYFDAVVAGVKRFELRKNDRNFQVGERICLREWDGEQFTGRNIVYIITYVLKDCPEYGLKDGYCIIGF